METEKKVLSNELRKKLAEAGGLGFTENSEFIYTPALYREKIIDTDEYKLPKEVWPTFLLRGKDGVESSKMEDGMGHMEYDDKTSVRRWVGKSGTRRIAILQDGIKGWKNFYNSDGELIPFRENNGKISSDSLKLIPVNIAIDIANTIIERTSLSQEELEGLES